MMPIGSSGDRDTMDCDIEEISDLHIMRHGEGCLFSLPSAEAFEGYPLLDYLLCGKYNKKAVIKFIEASLNGNIVSIAPDADVNSTALFIPPGKDKTKTIPYLLGGGLHMMLILSHSSIRRLSSYEELCSSIRSRYSDDKCWYLFILAARPRHQGKGGTSGIVRPMLDYFDRIGQSCFLETQSGDNVKIYEHWGFEVVETDRLPGTEVPHYAMLRRPVPL
jgi:hypothetical protein